MITANFQALCAWLHSSSSCAVLFVHTPTCKAGTIKGAHFTEEKTEAQKARPLAQGP